MWKCAVLYHKEPDVSQTSWRMAFTKCFQPLESEATQVQKKKWGHVLSRRTFLKQNLTRQTRDRCRCCCWWWWWWETFNKRWMKMGGFSQTLDQDLCVVGDRSREEGVPSRFGRGTGMCPLIRLGNYGGRERGWELARWGRRLYESCFPVRNCSIVTALVSCFFYSLYLFLFVSVPCTSATEGEVNIICAQRIRCGVCGGGVVYACVCVFHKWGAALKPVHPVQTGSPGLKQEVFTGFPLPLTSAETGHLCWTCLLSLD